MFRTCSFPYSCVCLVILMAMTACTPDPVAGPDRTLAVPQQVRVHEQILQANGCVIQKTFDELKPQVEFGCDDSRMTSSQVYVVERAFDNLGKALQLSIYYMPQSRQRMVMQTELESVQRFYNHSFQMMRNRVQERERPTPPRHRKP